MEIQEQFQENGRLGRADSVAQQFGFSQPLSLKVVIEPPINVTRDRGDKNFSDHL